MRRAQTLGLHTTAILRELGYDGGRIAMIAREAHPVDRFTRAAGIEPAFAPPRENARNKRQCPTAMKKPAR
ncbi:hypothetical protein AAFM48_18490 [Burkholderia pseudomallei]